MPDFSDRPLNRIEQNLLHLDQVTNFSFVVVARGRGRLDADLLRTALSHVARQHFYLNTAIELAPSPRFVVQDARPFPLRQVAAADEGRWLREAEAELNTRFDLRLGPLARAVLLERSAGWDLLVTFEHLAADGVAGVRFVQEVLAACGRLLRGEVLPPPVAREESFPDVGVMPPGVFGLRGAGKLLRFFLRLGGEAVLAAAARTPREWVPFERRAVRLTHQAFPVAETTELVAACHAAQTTVHGALAAALLLTLAEELRAARGLAAPRLRCVSSVNARPYCRGAVPDTQLGLWVGQALRSYRVRPAADFWGLARRVTRDLRRALATDELFVPYRLLFRRVYPDPVAFVRAFEHACPYIEVTNVGQLPGGTDQGPLTLEQLHFASGLQFTQASPWGLTVATTTYAGRLLANFHFLARYWDEAAAGRATRSAVERLRQAAGSVEARAS